MYTHESTAGHCSPHSEAAARICLLRQCRDGPEEQRVCPHKLHPDSPPFCSHSAVNVEEGKDQPMVTAVCHPCRRRV